MQPLKSTSQLAPTDDLKTLVPCYDTLMCGRLNVPLDHARPDGPKAVIALAVIPATDKENYKGAQCPPR